MREIAAIMDLSYRRAAQLLAARRRPTRFLGFAPEWRGPFLRQFLTQDVPDWLGFAAAQQARTLRVVASDSVREAMERYLERPRRGPWETA